jgi:predicted nucleic acid-binding OB-fold protein
MKEINEGCAEIELIVNELVMLKQETKDEITEITAGITQIMGSIRNINDLTLVSKESMQDIISKIGGFKTEELEFKEN